jgi:hypothetical protein
LPPPSTAQCRRPASIPTIKPSWKHEPPRTATAPAMRTVVLQPRLWFEQAVGGGGGDNDDAGEDGGDAFGEPRRLGDGVAAYFIEYVLDA